MNRGDLDAVNEASSRAGQSRVEAMIATLGKADVAARMKQGGAAVGAQLGKVQRLFERGKRAVLVVSPDTYLSLVKEDGAWKMGD